MSTIDFRHDLLPLKDKIFRLALRITANRQDAEDLTQDTLLRVWTKREEMETVNNLEAFCMTICRNLALDKLAAKEHANLSLEQTETDTFDNRQTPEEQMEWKDRLEKVNRILQALPEKMRTAIQLREIEGMTYQEAAAVMRITEEDFKVSLHRARKLIRQRFENIENHGL
ncbi:MAG: RNA polymerase sigma factor [Alloprevotella sp.]